MDTQVDSSIVAFTQEPLHALGLKAALRDTPFGLVAVLTEVDEIPRAVREFAAQVVLFDAARDVGFDQLRRLRGLLPGGNIVAMLAHASTAHAAPLQEMGIQGIIRRDAALTELAACLERVSRGCHWVDAMLEPVLQRGRRGRLTAREMELVRLVSEGMSNKEIGAALGITEGTVKGNLSKLFRKVGVDDRLELAMHGVKRLGLAPRASA